MANKNLTERMKNLLTNDRLQGKDGLKELLKSEAYKLLSDFFELDDERLAVAIEPQGDGYQITIKAKATRVY